MTKSAKNERIFSLDLLRGLVMILMTLDHTRTFFFDRDISPTVIEQTNPALFFTRWITHFCAPSFILLAGASAFLLGSRKGASVRQSFLWKRGLWLILLEITVVKFGWLPEPFYLFTLLQVIWILGWSMLLLSPFSRLPPYVLACIGAGIALSHHLLDSIKSDRFGPLAFLWSILHEPQRFEPLPNHTIVVSYPLIPWIGVMAMGFGLGKLYLERPSARQDLLRRMGLGLSLGFILLRIINLYGNPAPWVAHKQLSFMVISFLNCEKYPPSLAFLLMTIGPILLLLSVLERQNLWGWIGQRLILLGRVPLFFYIVHLYLLRITSLVLAQVRWGATAFLPPPNGHLGNPEYPLWAIYLIFIAAILILLPICRAYANFKRRRSVQFWWLRYL